MEILLAVLLAAIPLYVGYRLGRSSERKILDGTAEIVDKSNKPIESKLDEVIRHMLPPPEEATASEVDRVKRAVSIGEEALAVVKPGTGNVRITGHAPTVHTGPTDDEWRRLYQRALEKGYSNKEELVMLLWSMRNWIKHADPSGVQSEWVNEEREEG